ncbi:nucleotidyltransferase domain-containing protein [Methanobrevibacter curvatus]|uniref:protein adenylyltransferase n=1 Tax=Methanobrevibacter curvatus TaxID=49547 RepID=A0A165YY07_9EURY|nr:nucleotidyltransferase domain-containing protein [Methanobrevibacter curvatus]KZX10004.1 nucleotidyltransferase domain protein [Methanobrevibacter curvatus]
MDRKQIAIEFAQSLNHPEIEKIILFGSVARGEDNKNSDIDILILTTNKEDKNIISDDVYDKVWNILMKTGQYVSAKINNINQYEEQKKFSFFKNLDKEGVIIG